MNMHEKLKQALVCKTQSIINEFINNSLHDLQLIAMMALIQFIQQLYASQNYGQSVKIKVH